MANIEKIKAIGKAWKKNDGSVCYYINDWMDMIGLEVEYYKSGNVSGVCWSEKFDNWTPSNCWFKKNVLGTKVWVSEEGQVHVDYCKDKDVERSIIEAVTAAIQ